MLRILIVDDHEIVRRGLKEILSERQTWEVCGEASNGREAVKLAVLLRPNVVVMDLSMPELNGLEATRQLQRELPDCQVLMLSHHDSEDLVREALYAGARGFILKSDAAHHLITAVEMLSRKKPYFTGVISDSILRAFLKSAGGPDMSTLLTIREREIVQLLAEGKSNKDIAQYFSISPKTVETHRASVMRKLDINSIVQLVHYAIRNQLVEA